MNIVTGGYCMGIGAIFGDIIGFRFEKEGMKSIEFELITNESRFSDDTVLTVAIMDSIIHKKDYTERIRYYTKKYPDAGYGKNFKKWVLEDNPEPNNSYGNGSAMRVSPIGFAFNDIRKVLSEAKKSSEITHNHPEAIKGAQAIASAIYWARKNKGKKFIKNYIQEKFGYNLERTIDSIRPEYKFDVSCQGSVPESIIAFLESNSYIEAIRLAVSLGGDSDTMACMAGGIAEAYYKEIPKEVIDCLKIKLPKEFLEIITKFYAYTKK